MKDKPQAKEKRFLNHVSEIRLVLIIYSEVLQLNKTDNQFLQKWMKNWNRYLIRENIQMANKHKKMLSIISHLGNANNRQSRILLYPQQNDYNRMIYNKKESQY